MKFNITAIFQSGMAYSAAAEASTRETPQWQNLERLLAFKEQHGRWPTEKDTEAGSLVRFRARLCRVLRGEGNVEAWPSQLLSAARKARVQDDNPRRAGPPLPVKGRQAEMLARLQAGQPLDEKELNRLRCSYSNGNLSNDTARMFAAYGIQLAS